MRIGFRLFTILLTTMIFHVAMVAGADTTRWEEFAEFAKTYSAIDPTPTGDGHLGQIDSRQTVQLRFPVPQPDFAGYWLHLSNVVGYTGRGTSYQLILHRDSAAGLIVYQGPVSENGDDWNVSNRQPIDLTDHLTAVDRQRGYLDIYVSGYVVDDGWTVYRHRPGQRPILARVALLTAEVQASMAAEKALRGAGIALIPQPNSVVLRDGPSCQLLAGAAIRYSGAASEYLIFVAKEVRSLVLERTGIELRVTGNPQQADGKVPIILRLARQDELAGARELRNP